MASPNTGKLETRTMLKRRRFRSCLPRYLDMEQERNGFPLIIDAMDLLHSGTSGIPSAGASSVGDAHHELAEVGPLEQADERRRRVLQPVDHVLAQLHPAGGDPGVHVAAEGVEALGVVV